MGDPCSVPVPLDVRSAEVRVLGVERLIDAHPVGRMLLVVSSKCLDGLSWRAERSLRTLVCSTPACRRGCAPDGPDTRNLASSRAVRSLTVARRALWRRRAVSPCHSFNNWRSPPWGGRPTALNPRAGAARHSITSSACRLRNASGITSPMAFAVLRLTTSWNFVGN
jgi:hypothetical protein